MSSRPISSTAETRPQSTAAALLGWVVAFACLAVLVARRLGAFSLWTNVTLADGSRRRMPNALGLVDHPFHAVRAESLRRALADGHMLRWIGQHQGGYPVEFYPLGVAGLDVAAWGAAFGSLPMVLIHKLVVIGIFLAPLIGYALIAGFDRRSLGVGLLAGAAHVAIRGWWWSGGAMELYEWGLVTNVAAVTALVIALPLAVRYVAGGARRMGAFAALLAAFALVTNPRSGFALAALLVGAGLATLLDRVERPSLSVTCQRIGLLGVVAGLLAAPELVSLARYSHLYYFVRYQEYADLHAYWDSSLQATGGPAFVLGIAGFALALLPGARLLHRATAITLALYVATTAALVTGTGPERLISQLETPRLMPFQRFLWFMLAAIAVETLLGLSLRFFKLRSLSPVADVALLGLAALTLVLYVIEPPAFIPTSDRGLVQMPTAATAGIADLEDAVKAADGAAVSGTALLVLGTTLSWHDQLWAPLWSDRPFFYDDWLWYWQTKHYGDYDPLTEHAYRSDASALEPEYLARHGIGGIIVTGEAKAAARRDAGLTLVRAGTWDVYRVNAPTTIVSFDGAAPKAETIGNQTISATGVVSGGQILVRRNWFPRWEATVNGKPASIRQTDDGYMTISAPPGDAVVELRYGLDWLDWLARAAAAIGLVAVAGLLLPRRTTLRLRPGEAKSVPRVIPTARSERR